jgi:chromosome segregation ATPase
MPPECANRAYEERNLQGELIKKYAAPLTPEQQARRDAELARQEEARRQALEEKRQAQALLANYANEKEIDAARDRALAPIEQNMKKAQVKLDAATKAKQRLDKERKAQQTQPLPAELTERIRSNESELQAHQAAIGSYNKEMDTIRARFADEKKRYLEAAGKAPTAEAATPATPATPPAGK